MVEYYGKGMYRVALREQARTEGRKYTQKIGLAETEKHEIRELYLSRPDLSYLKLADLYGVSKSTIGRVIRGKIGQAIRLDSGKYEILRSRKPDVTKAGLQRTIEELTEYAEKAPAVESRTEKPTRGLKYVVAPIVRGTLTAAATIILGLGGFFYAAGKTAKATADSEFFSRQPISQVEKHNESKYAEEPNLDEHSKTTRDDSSGVSIAGSNLGKIKSTYKSVASWFARKLKKQSGLETVAIESRRETTEPTKQKDYFDLDEFNLDDIRISKSEETLEETARATMIENSTSKRKNTILSDSGYECTKNRIDKITRQKQLELEKVISRARTETTEGVKTREYSEKPSDLKIPDREILHADVINLNNPAYSSKKVDLEKLRQRGLSIYEVDNVVKKRLCGKKQIPEARYALCFTDWNKNDSHKVYVVLTDKEFNQVGGKSWLGLSDSERALESGAGYEFDSGKILNQILKSKEAIAFKNGKFRFANGEERGTWQLSLNGVPLGFLTSNNVNALDADTEKLNPSMAVEKFSAK